MFQSLKRQDKAKMPPSSGSHSNSALAKSLSAIAMPGMYLFYKYTEFKRQQEEIHRKKVTEKELDHLNHKIDKLLAKIDDQDTDIPRCAQAIGAFSEEEEECVICMSAKATMQTYPCAHKVICRKCFIKTIQTSVRYFNQCCKHARHMCIHYYTCDRRLPV